MNRNPEALQFLSRAKARESENPFVLDLESRILEDMNRLDAAYESALLASARDPLNGHLHNRLGLIRNKQGKSELSISHFQKAIELDSDQFSPVNSLASAFLDNNNTQAAEGMVAELGAKARTPADRALVEHTKARIAFAKNDLLGSEKTLKQEISHSHNLVPNLGLLTRVECALFDQNIGQFPAIADVALASAEQALVRIIDLDVSNRFIEILRAGVVERRQRRAK
jgi:tetratricopeptide (TPR) repeat protein